MKKFIGILMAYLAAYVCFSYISLEPNMFAWNESTRVGYLVIGSIWAFFALAYIDNQKK